MFVNINKAQNQGVLLCDDAIVMDNILSSGDCEHCIVYQATPRTQTNFDVMYLIIVKLLCHSLV